MLDQFEEVVEEMPRNVVEFLDENMGQVGNNLEEEEEVGNFLEEGWGNLVEEYFNGDDVAALQVIVLFYSPSPRASQTPSNPIFNIVSKFGAILLCWALIVRLIVRIIASFIAGFIEGNIAQC